MPDEFLQRRNLKRWWSEPICPFLVGGLFSGGVSCLTIGSAWYGVAPAVIFGVMLLLALHTYEDYVPEWGGFVIAGSVLAYWSAHFAVICPPKLVIQEYMSQASYVAILFGGTGGGMIGLMLILVSEELPKPLILLALPISGACTYLVMSMLSLNHQLEHALWHVSLMTTIGATAQVSKCWSAMQYRRKFPEVRSQPVGET